MKKQMSLLSKLQSFDSQMDATYKSGLPDPNGPRKLTKKQKLLASEREPGIRSPGSAMQLSTLHDLPYCADECGKTPPAQSVSSP